MLSLLHSFTSCILSDDIFLCTVLITIWVDDGSVSGQVILITRTEHEGLSPYDPRKKKGSFLHKYEESHTPKSIKDP